MGTRFYIQAIDATIYQHDNGDISYVFNHVTEVERKRTKSIIVQIVMAHLMSGIDVLDERYQEGIKLAMSQLKAHNFIGDDYGSLCKDTEKHNHDSTEADPLPE